MTEPDVTYLPVEEPDQQLIEATFDHIFKIVLEELTKDCNPV